MIYLNFFDDIYITFEIIIYIEHEKDTLYIYI